MRRPVRPLATVLVATLTTSTTLVGGQLLAAAPAAADAADCHLPPPAGVGNEHEGWPPDYGRWLEPEGTLNGIFLFVDFDGAVGTAAERDGVVDDFDPELADWFDDASYGQVTLDLDFTASWQRMPEDHDDYGWPVDLSEHQKYMQDAVDQWDATVDFAQYDLFYVVSPEAATGIASSPAWISTPTTTVMGNNGTVELAHGSTLARDRATWGYQILAHETGHVFGLPDLYEYDVTDRHRHVGGWDTMGRVNGPAPDYLAYHKWRMGWLDDTQIVCVDSHGTLQQTLAPLHTATGVKAVVVRIDTDRAVVVENRDAGSAIDGTPGVVDCYQAGVLAYVVDSRVGGGGDDVEEEPEVVMPVTVVDANPGTLAGCSDNDVAEKANATLTGVSDSVETEGVEVELTGINGADRQVQVSWPQPASGPCEVDYVVTNTWAGNVQVDLVVENNSATEPINGWTAEWTFTGDEDVYNSWGVAVSQVGTAATATGDGWGVTIPPGDSVTVGFQATVTGAPTVPTPISCTT